MRKLTRQMAATGTLCIALVTALTIGTDVASGTDGSAAAATGKQGKIANAMSAAPRSVSGQSTILDYPTRKGAAPTTLRAGSNDWACFPDYPATPGNDPMCLDEQALAWFEAYTAGKQPKLSAVGLAYMLEGGVDASNTDPFATEPAPGEHWMKMPPHVMVFPTGKLNPKNYSTEPHTGGPFVMWAGTAYEHYMIPVK